MRKLVGALHRFCNKHEWVIGLLILVLILRVPSFFMPHYYGDEEIYFVMGRAWRQGVPLYQAMFDHKPPLIYILAGLAPSMFAFRGVLALLMMFHTYLFWKLAQAIWAKSRVKLAYVSSLLFVLLTTLPTFEGLTVNAELLMMVPVTWAALILWNARVGAGVRPYLLAGMLGGIGWLFKIPVAFDMMALGLYFLVFRQKTWQASVKALLSLPFVAYTLAFVAPLALTFVYYYLKGSGPDYLATVVSVNLGYVSSWSTSTYAFNPLKSGLVVRGLVLFGLTLGLYGLRHKLDKTLILPTLWGAFALFGALLSGRPYPHYLQEVVPAVALLIPSVFVTESVVGWGVIAVLTLVALLAQRQIKFGAYPTLSVYNNFVQYATGKISWQNYLERFDNARRNYAVADYLRERMGGSDSLYIWGTDPTIYNLTGKLPAGGKYIVSFHVHDLNQYDYTMTHLQANMPKYILILPGSGDYPRLTSLLAQRYVHVSDIDGVEIYLRLVSE